jgi:hypothetical protein
MQNFGGCSEFATPGATTRLAETMAPPEHLGRQCQRLCASCVADGLVAGDADRADLNQAYRFGPSRCQPGEAVEVFPPGDGQVDRAVPVTQPLMALRLIFPLNSLHPAVADSLRIAKRLCQLSAPKPLAFVKVIATWLLRWKGTPVRDTC